jgi:hypothetical protein
MVASYEITSGTSITLTKDPGLANIRWVAGSEIIYDYACHEANHALANISAEATRNGKRGTGEKARQKRNK